MYYYGQGVSYNPQKTEELFFATANKVSDWDAQVLLAGFYSYRGKPLKDITRHYHGMRRQPDKIIQTHSILAICIIMVTVSRKTMTRL